ncbi:MAG TPA: ATPase [Hadesarchaea archaeon]|nr:ATPase [Hadesarchaea archaeon]
MTKYVPDASVIINGFLKRLAEGELVGSEILVPNAVVAQIEYQAKQSRDSGLIGLAELGHLQKSSNERGIKLSFVGDRPTAEELSSANFTIDAEIREIARSQGAVLITSDAVMAEISQMEGIETRYLEHSRVEEKPRLLKYFDQNTMSVHLKARVRPMAKVGRPGRFRIQVLDEKPVEENELREIAHEILEFAKRDPDGFIEFEREGASLIQFREYRIAITRPPFSDGFEITAVRPVVWVRLEDYGLSDKLKVRLRERAEGVLIAGPPGAGKTTFAQALAGFYSSQGKIVKTMESPRDLQVGDEITQYTALEGDMTKTADLLLLVRPDYTVYDELRKTSDFQIFADMRLAGVGMVGVVHSTRAIDAVQRLIGRVELGMIPMIVDTVIFIKDGEIREIYSLKTVVRVPSGMAEADLARPLIEVLDFETGEPRYEIYTFGEQIVVSDLRGVPTRPRYPGRKRRWR